MPALFSKVSLLIQRTFVRFCIAMLAGSLPVALSISTSSCSDSEMVEFTPMTKGKNNKKRRPKQRENKLSQDVTLDVDEEEVDVAPNGISEEDIDLCTENGEINMVLVFDNSSSQSSGDLESMRSGATNLVNQLSNIGLSKKFQTNVSVVRFSSTATPGLNGWNNVNDGRAQILQDITEATTDDSGSTQYQPALNEVENLFVTAQAGLAGDDKRNFVVFLSDGRPDDDEGVAAVTQQLADTFNAAFLTIGTGSDDFDVLQAMAQTRGNNNYPAGHQGKFFAAEDQANLATVFNQVYAIFDGVCPNI